MGKPPDEALASWVLYSQGVMRVQGKWGSSKQMKNEQEMQVNHLHRSWRDRLQSLCLAPTSEHTAGPGNTELGGRMKGIGFCCLEKADFAAFILTESLSIQVVSLLLQWVGEKSNVHIRVQSPEADA